MENNALGLLSLASHLIEASGDLLRDKVSGFSNERVLLLPELLQPDGGFLKTVTKRWETYPKWSEIVDGSWMEFRPRSVFFFF